MIELGGHAAHRPDDLAARGELPRSTRRLAAAPRAAPAPHVRRPVTLGPNGPQGRSVRRARTPTPRQGDERRDIGAGEAAIERNVPDGNRQEVRAAVDRLIEIGRANPDAQ